MPFKRKNFKLPLELMDYLQERARRSGKSLDETLEDLVRESLRYEILVTEMTERRPMGKPFIGGEKRWPL